MLDSETKFKQYFRARLDDLGVWSECYEPRRGSGVGMPDLQILAKLKLLPVELKIGTTTDVLLFPEEIRPAQISWLDRFVEAGGHALLIVGVREGRDWYGLQLPSVRTEYLSTWRAGFDLRKCPVVIERGRFTPAMIRQLKF